MIDGDPKPNRVQSLFEPTHGKQVTGDSDSPLTPLDEPQKKEEAARGWHTHTHTIYALFDECLAPGPSDCTPHRGLSRDGIGVTRRVRDPPPPPP
eukprot:scaffold99023_cov65-Phaeocystis_antarctica.AAC.1